MLNYWEFEGAIVKVFENDDGKKFLNLKGTTDEGYPVMFTCYIDSRFFNRFEIKSGLSIQVVGHHETWCRKSNSGFLREKRVDVVDEIIQLV